VTAAATATVTSGRSRSPVTAAAVVLFGVMASHALLETARDALFLTHLGPHRLAWAYLVIAASSSVAFVGMRRLIGLRDPRTLLIGVLVGAVVGTCVLAATIASSRSVVFVLYVWTGLVATLVVPCFWTLIDRSMSVAEAKRHFALIGGGGIAGALVGSAVAALLGRLTEPHHLVTAGALAFAITTVAATILAPTPEREPAPRRERRGRSAMPRRTYRYIRWLAATTAVATVALTLGDLAFKRAVSEHLAAEDLATTFGVIYTGLNLVSLGVQLVLAPRILDRFGVGVAMAILPSLLLLTALGFAVTALLAAIIALKVGDGSLRHSLHRVTSELLYLPMPAHLRDGAKPIADAIGQRGGQVIAVVAVLAAASVGGIEPSSRFLAIVAAAAALVWLGLVPWVRGAYIDQFRGMLATGARHDAPLPRLDASAMELLHRALASPDEPQALAALELLAAQRRPVPALVLYHPRAAVVRRALELVGGARYPDVAAIVEHLVEHADPEIRAASLAVSDRAGRDHGHLERALVDPHPQVRATAAVNLADDAAHAPAVTACVAELVAGTPADRRALARAIARAPSESWRGTLAELLARRETEVVHEVLDVYARLPALVELPRLVHLLEDFRVREDVRRVFVAAGERSLELLVNALHDPQTPVAVRRHIPRTLSRLGSAAAARALVARLPHESDGITELKLLRALGRMRHDERTLAIDDEPLRVYLRRTVAVAARFAILVDHMRAHDGPPAAAGALLRELLDEKRASAVERVFRTLGILQPGTELRRVHDALTGDDDGRRAAAREIAEAVVDAQVRTRLFAAIDDLTADERRRRLGDLAPGPFHTDASFLAEVLGDSSESVRGLAACYAEELGLPVVEPGRDRGVSLRSRSRRGSGPRARDTRRPG
jgi:AAA family ATP:ADP antiporter